MADNFNTFISNSNIDPATTAIGISPVARVSVEQYVDFHAILDSELQQLSNPDAGIIGSIGFTALGGAIGFLPTAYSFFSNSLSSSATAPTLTDLVTLILASLCSAVAIVCLTIFVVKKYRSAGLVQKIRERPKFIGQSNPSDK